MKNTFIILYILFLPNISFGQTILSSTVPYENGDQITYIYRELPSGKPAVLNYTFDEITDKSFVGRFYKADQKGDSVLPIRSTAPGTVGDEVCYGAFEKCSFNPPIKLFDKNIKVGDEWQQSARVVGETFTSDLTQEVKVIKQERLRIGIGEFDALKVVAKGKFKGVTTKGDKFSATETLELWVGNVRNKVVSLKINYSNSLQEKWSTELVRGP